jgi:hypothetical protein
MKSKKHFLLLSLLMQLLFVINTFSQVTEKCGTFSPENLAKIGMGCSRPPFYPSHLPVQTIETNRFIVHFITDGIPPLNYTPPGDETTWDYAQKVAQAAEASWNFQITNLGWQAPPGDGDCGGGHNKYDIYIMRRNFFGEVRAETQVQGTNGFTSYMVITSRMEVVQGAGIRPLTDEEIKVTVAHEFNHALHFGYN